jgi:hypothetical protein
MSRPSRVRAMALGALFVAAGCQDYNFNPVGHCLIVPNTKRVELSDVTTADVLFVVDDSGSMGGEQSKLSAAFTAFVGNLDATNVARVADGLEPIDFHLAVTTTSVFYNDATGAQCRSDCPGAAAGASVCCNMSNTTPVGPYRTVQTCTGTADTSCGAGACRQDCQEWVGDWVCCDPTTKVPALDTALPCSDVGSACGDLRTHYVWDPATPGCTSGHATNWARYPQGDFVGDPAAPRVIHFDKQLYNCSSPPCTNEQGYTAAELRTFFTQNVVAGTCGSNQEQALQAARLAVQKALAGEQLDTRTTSSTTPTTAAATWLGDHAKSKLVLVFVGDEDDCSSPQDASGGVVMTGGFPGADACVADQALPAAEQKETAVSAFVDYFTNLPADRPLGAAFIVSARSAASDNYCEDETCYADVCCDTACSGGACTTNVCGGQAKASRLLEAASQLRNKTAAKAPVDVVAGSICDPNFNIILDRIAEIVKPPNGLLLPSQPADAAVSVLRIARSDGKTRKTCFGPAPATMTAAEARAAGYDWWYTASRDQVTPEQQQPTLASRFVLINHDTHNCEASGGETYSADYIARLPAGGCFGATAEEADAACVTALGGRAGDWTCFAGTDSGGACIIPTGGVVGTCLCGERGGPTAAGGTGNCPNG